MRRSSRPAERGSFKPKRDAKSTGRPARRFDTLSLLSPRLLARIERARVAAIPTPLLQLTIERARVASPLRFLRQLETGTPARSRSRPHPCYASLRRPPLQSGAMYASPPLPILLSTPSPSRCVVTVRHGAIGGRASNGFLLSIQHAAAAFPPAGTRWRWHSSSRKQRRKGGSLGRARQVLGATNAT